MRIGLVFKKDVLAGKIWENESGFFFQYNESYLQNPVYGVVSKTLPLRQNAFTDSRLLPFFDGLIPEGWLLKIAVENWNLNYLDRMGLLLTLCKDCIGDIGIINEEL